MCVRIQPQQISKKDPYDDMAFTPGEILQISLASNFNHLYINRIYKAHANILIRRDLKGRYGFSTFNYNERSREMGIWAAHLPTNFSFQHDTDTDEIIKGKCNTKSDLQMLINTHCK